MDAREASLFIALCARSLYPTWCYMSRQNHLVIYIQVTLKHSATENYLAIEWNNNFSPRSTCQMSNTAFSYHFFAILFLPYSSGSTINFVSLIESCLIRLIYPVHFSMPLKKNQSLICFPCFLFFVPVKENFAFANTAEGNPLCLNSINPSSTKEINRKRIKQIFKRYTQRKKNKISVILFLPVSDI